MAILGLDVGTTCVKCQAFDAEGNILCYHLAEYDAVTDGRERYLDANLLWDKVMEVLSRAAAEQPIEGLAVSSLGESFVVLDREDRVLLSPMLYTDSRGEEEARVLAERFTEQALFERTGVCPHSMYSLPKLMWVRAHCPQVLDNAARILLVGDYVTYRLCGEAAVDCSLAARTGAFDIRGKRFVPELLELAGVHADKLSRPVPAGTVIGTVLRSVADRLGLPAGCKVVAGAHDQVCSALGAGAVSAGESVDGMGTVECITPVFRTPPQDIRMGRMGYPVVPFAIDGLYVTYLLSYSCGALIKWFRDTLMADQSARLKERGESFYKLYENGMENAPSGLLTLPYFAGAATPYMDNSARGVIAGLDLATKPERIYRSLMEASAFEMRLNLEKVRAFGADVRQVTATGGGANSAAWLRLKADILGIPVSPLRSSEAGICGCAMLTAAALGHTQSLEESAQVFVRRSESIEPDPAGSRRYEEWYQKYVKMYAAFAEVMK